MPLRKSDAEGVPDIATGAIPADMISLQVLTSWFSPSYPVGAYSYSHGLEWAIEDNTVRNGEDLQGWISDLLAFGAGRSDAILVAEAYRSSDPHDLMELAEALTPSSERHLETMAQGTAFARTTAAVWNIPLEPMPYPVAVGTAARTLALPLQPLLMLFVQAFAANIVSAGVRLIPLGQTEGQKTTARLMPLIERVAREAEESTVATLGSMSTGADLASMLHETQYTRLYRS